MTRCVCGHTREFHNTHWPACRGFSESPTREEIAHGTAQIRAGWSASERLKRAGVNRSEPWRPPVTRIAWDEFDERLTGVGTFHNDGGKR